MSLHVDVVRDTSEVIDNVAVCVIRHNVQNSSRILNILLPGSGLRFNYSLKILIIDQHLGLQCRTSSLLLTLAMLS